MSCIMGWVGFVGVVSCGRGLILVRTAIFAVAGCHLKCHKEHADNKDSAMQPCVGGEEDSLCNLIEQRGPPLTLCGVILTLYGYH